jgi:hypothetical protein
MRLKIALAAVAALSLLGPAAARADFSLNLDPLSLPSPGNTVTVMGTFTNLDTVNGTTIDNTTPSLSGFGPSGSGASSAAMSSINDLFAGSGGVNLPVSLAAGGTTGDVPLFSFTYDSTVHDVEYNAVTLDANGATILFQTTGVGVFPTAVPEPGSIAMLVGGAFGGGFFLLRRRRK